MSYKSEAEALIKANEKEIDIIQDIINSHHKKMISVITMLEYDSRIIQSALVEHYIQHISLHLRYILENSPAEEDTLIEYVVIALKRCMSGTHGNGGSSIDDSMLH